MKSSGQCPNVKAFPQFIRDLGPYLMASWASLPRLKQTNPNPLLWPKASTATLADTMSPYQSNIISRSSSSRWLSRFLTNRLLREDVMSEPSIDATARKTSVRQVFFLRSRTKKSRLQNRAQEKFYWAPIGIYRSWAKAHHCRVTSVPRRFGQKSPNFLTMEPEIEPKN